MIDDKVLEKLQKILRLANGKGATQGEVEAAMQRAKELAMKHQIDLATISLEDPNSKSKFAIETDKQEFQLRSKKEQLYHHAIYNVLRHCFGVRTVRLRSYSGDRICLIGEVTDVAICKSLFAWLEDVFYSTYYEAKQRGLVRSCAADKRGIYHGLSLGIQQVNKRAEDLLSKEDKSKWALVVRSKTEVVDQRVSEEFPNARIPKQREVELARRALNHGYEKGKTIRLNQVGSATNRTAIT